MLGVMRVEFQRARSQRYPLCCLVLCVDGLERIGELGGFAGKEAALARAYEALKSAARESGAFGMALSAGERALATFPNMPPERLGTIAARMLEILRSTQIELRGETFPLRVSLGASHNLLADTNASFEGLVERAGRALWLATEAGGDRYVMWREAEAEIEGLREELAQRKRSFEEERTLLSDEASDVGGLQQAEIEHRLQEIFARFPRTDDVAALEKAVLDFAARELYAERHASIERALEEHRRETDRLERRIGKLTQLLGMTEEELKRVMAMKQIDSGIASIYRTVQGLTGDEGQAEQKRAMMADIFKQNLAFQQRREPAGAST